MVTTTIKFIFWDLLGDIIRFPAWWLTTGIKKSFLSLLNKIKNASESLGVGIWIKNLFKPMFGVRDWQGRIISFIVRIIQIIFRSIFLLIYVIFSIFLFFLWILLPIFIILQIINIIFIHGKL